MALVLAVVSLALGTSVRSAQLDPRAMCASQVSAGPFPKEMLDPLRAPVRLPRPPMRIASKALVADELLEAVVPVERIAALTNLIDDESVTVLAGRVPASVRRTGGGVEELLALAPDLVVVAEFTEGAATAQLVSAGAPVLRLAVADGFEAVRVALRSVGAATGCEERAGRVIDDLDARIAAVRSRSKGRLASRVLFLMGGRYGAGEGTIVDEAIDAAGGLNVARELGVRGVAPIAVEQIVATQPDVVLVSASTERVRPATEADLDPSVPWRVLEAMRGGRVFAVPSTWFGSISHQAVRAVEAVDEILAALPSERAR